MRLTFGGVSAAILMGIGAGLGQGCAPDRNALTVLPSAPPPGTCHPITG